MIACFIVIYLMAVIISGCIIPCHVWKYFDGDKCFTDGTRCCKICEKTEMRDFSGEDSGMWTHRPGMDGMNVVKKTIRLRND